MRPQPKWLEPPASLIFATKATSDSSHRAIAARRKRAGDFSLFLNNDTEVTAGWLGALRETFQLDPRAGLVGAKLVFPDGRLQEAGGIIWRDATGWNFGKFDDPEKPEYNFLREVDYCSAACVMVPKSLFDSVGGFDPRFAPAYYEDVDLAFKIRRAGGRRSSINRLAESFTSKEPLAARTYQPAQRNIRKPIAQNSPKPGRKFWPIRLEMAISPPTKPAARRTQANSGHRSPLTDARSRRWLASHVSHSGFAAISLVIA